MTHQATEEVLSLSTVDVVDGLSPEIFKDIFRNYPAGVALITADDGTRPNTVQLDHDGLFGRPVRLGPAAMA